MDAIQSSLSACTKQQPGNTIENSDSHRVINTVRAQKFSTEKCTQGRVVVNQNMFAFHKLLTGTPTHFSVQSRTSVNKTPLQEPLGGRPRTAMDSRCRIPPSALSVISVEILLNGPQCHERTFHPVVEVFQSFHHISSH